MSETPQATSDTEIILHLITQRYGSRLTPSELEEVRKGVAGLAQVTAALQRVPLTNSDEPFAVFIPYRQEG
jgi:hypothetical protein